MLGKLTDEFSCANSRFFRTSLYSNKEISNYLRDNFVLHWQSVRPVPRVTIDFGDGRKLERTLTGNSAHYVLTARRPAARRAAGPVQPAAVHRMVNANAGAQCAMEHHHPGSSSEAARRFPHAAPRGHPCGMGF